MLHKITVFTCLCFALAIAGCGSSSVTNGDGGGGGQDLAGGGNPDMAGQPPSLMMQLGAPPMGAAITPTADQWTWVDFPDAVCDDGTATGVGVFKSSTSSNVIVFLNGGGACWDYATCYQLNTAAHGPFGDTQFQAALTNLQSGTIFDRTDAANPFKDYSMVFVPYCTGDVHAGDNVMMYSNGGAPRTYHHAGHANILAYLKRLGPTFPTPGKLVVAGSSAGGFGALLNYAYFRWYWPSTTTYLIDDSGPPFEQDDLPQNYLPSWITSWKFDALLNQTCGMACTSDLSAGVPALVNAFPNDRLALLSSLQDQTIRSYFLLSGTGFEDALLRMTTDRLEPTAHFKYFYVTGQTHTMLGAPGNFTSNATPLKTWLTQEVTDDGAWASTKP
jgi:Pectinacetylesterase